MAMPKKLPLIGHLPVVKQFQTLGMLLVTFLVFAALMVFLDNRQSAQGGAAAATATEMQMLSQRLARGSALAAQGQATAFAAVKDSRDRFKADLDALLNGGTVRGVSLDVAQDETTVKLLTDVKQRWERVDVGGRAAAGERDEPDVAGQGAGGAQRRQQRAAGTGAAGGRADRAGRRVAARDRVHEPARRAVAADREERQHARVVRRNRPRGRVPARAATPARSATSSTGCSRAATRCASRRCAATRRAPRWPSCRSASPRTKAASTRS